MSIGWFHITLRQFNLGFLQTIVEVTFRDSSENPFTHHLSRRWALKSKFFEHFLSSFSYSNFFGKRMLPSKLIFEQTKWAKALFPVRLIWLNEHDSKTTKTCFLYGRAVGLRRQSHQMSHKKLNWTESVRVVESPVSVSQKGTSRGGNHWWRERRRMESVLKE